VQDVAQAAAPVNGQPVEAFAHAQQALVLSYWLGDDTLHAQSLMYMADACRVSKQFDLAVHYIELAREPVRRLNNAPWMAYLDHTLGALDVEIGQYARAVDRLKRAQHFFHSVQDRASEVNSTQALGIALYRAGDDHAAEPMLLDAARGLKELGKGNELANVQFTLGKLYERTGRPGAAHGAYQEAMTLARSFDGPYYEALVEKIRAILSQLDEQSSAAD